MLMRILPTAGKHKNKEINTSLMPIDTPHEKSLTRTLHGKNVERLWSVNDGTEP
jgi:hypothetical protein